MFDRDDKPRVAVTQLGARRHYSVPVALERQGLLEHFYTDLYAGQGAIGAAVRLATRLAPTGAMKRWAGRATADLPPEKVTAFTRFGLEYRWRRRRSRTQTELTRSYLWAGRRFCQLVASCPIHRATAVLAYTSAALELFEEAKRRGLACILDHATAPYVHEENLVKAQEARYPGWSTALEEDKAAEAYAERQRQEWQLADTIICGSQFVRDMISREGGPVDKTIIVPLGLNRRFDDHQRPRRTGGPLNVLWVGDYPVRKGVGDLAEAAARLGRDTVHVRAVGTFNLTPYGLEQAGRTIEIVGRVPRSEMWAQYTWADVFVLPSVSDTFGLVILEAMAAGVPVVATPNTGGPDVIREGVDGFIVPIHDPEALAARLAQLAGDRALLAEMSRNARERAGDFTIERYSERLVAAIQHSVGQVASET